MTLSETLTPETKEAASRTNIYQARAQEAEILSFLRLGKKKTEKMKKNNPKVYNRNLSVLKKIIPRYRFIPLLQENSDIAKTVPHFDFKLAPEKNLSDPKKIMRTEEEIRDGIENLVQKEGESLDHIQLNRDIDTVLQNIHLNPEGRLVHKSIQSIKTFIETYDLDEDQFDLISSYFLGIKRHEKAHKANIFLCQAVANAARIAKAIEKEPETSRKISQVSHDPNLSDKEKEARIKDILSKNPEWRALYEQYKKNTEQYQQLEKKGVLFLEATVYYRQLHEEALIEEEMEEEGEKRFAYNKENPFSLPLHLNERLYKILETPTITTQSNIKKFVNGETSRIRIQVRNDRYFSNNFYIAFNKREGEFYIKDVRKTRLDPIPCKDIESIAAINLEKIMIREIGIDQYFSLLKRIGRQDIYQLYFTFVGKDSGINNKNTNAFHDFVKEIVVMQKDNPHLNYGELLQEEYGIFSQNEKDIFSLKNTRALIRRFGGILT